MMNAAAGAATISGTDGAPRLERRKRLSPAALAVTNEKVRKAYSTVVISGIVRIVDFLILSAVGLGLYAWYVLPGSGFSWQYAAAVFGVAGCAVVSFQAAEIKRGQRLWTNSGCATMGYDLPAAIGVHAATHGRQRIIAVAGDGLI